MNTYFPGLPDDEFIRGEIPMTKQEIRIIALTKAKISPGDTIIDIGAGTGSISIEASLQAEQGQVIAIEREPEGVDLIRRNAAKFQILNLEIREGSAPEALYALPAANVIFIGGSGGKLSDILDRADELLLPGGRLVILSVTVETLQTALAWTKRRTDYATDGCGVQVNRLRSTGSVHMFQALNQVFIVTCQKYDDR